MLFSAEELERVILLDAVGGILRPDDPSSDGSEVVAVEIQDAQGTVIK